MPLTGITVLVVDDNEAHNYAMSRMLTHLCSKVLRAGTGSEALHLALRKPTMILLDINLPDVNGYEVCRRLKANSATSAIPVVFITATSQHPHARAMADSVGASGFLFYPIEEDQLKMAILAQVRAP
jgi:CheY-like chemotaxis protein